MKERELQAARDEMMRFPWPWAASALLLLLAVYFRHELLPPPYSSVDYDTASLRVRIVEVEGYSRGMPKVRLADGRRVLLRLPGGAAQQHVQTGDSLVKAPGVEQVTVYRHFPRFTEVRVFGQGPNYGANDLDYPYSGLQQRYRIPATK